MNLLFPLGTKSIISCNLYLTIYIISIFYIIDRDILVYLSITK